MKERAAPRQKTFLRGTIFCNDRQKSVECIVRDLSDTGARLVLPSDATVPDEIELYVPKKQRSHFGAVKWRRADEIGMEFQRSRTNTGSVEEILRRLEKLEAEVAVLRRHARRRRVVEGAGFRTSLPSRSGS